MICFSCGKEIPLEENKVGIREECPHCGADAHVCKNFQFYDEKAYNECREPSAERVREKDRSNRCDYFAPTTTAQGPAVSGPSKQDQLRAAAEALFKKKN
jgi:hypothetical protein